MKKSKILLMGLSILMIAAIVFIIVKQNSYIDTTKASAETISSLHKQFGVYDQIPQLISIDPDYKLSLKKITKERDVVFIGEVVGNAEDFSYNLTKNYYQINVKVLETLKGEMDDNVILLGSKNQRSTDPVFKPGTRFLMITSKYRPDEFEDKYWISEDGMYFISDDDIVVSAISDKEVDRFSGLKLKALKKEFEKLIEEG